MGFFSWKTLDGNRSIPNIHSDRTPFPVVLLVPKEFGGKHLVEKEYDGYGEFGGKDAYELLAKWNAPDRCTGDLDHDRCLGIDLWYNTPESLSYEIRLVSLAHYKKTLCKYEDFDSPSEICPNQGYFY